MEKDDICITMGKNLKKLLDDYNISHEIFEGLTGINEERLNEIINAEGEELTVSEVYLMCNKMFISADYLAEGTGYPFLFKITDENVELIQKTIERIKAERKASGDDQIQ